MIRLLEHEAKAILAARGFAVPRGALYQEHGALPGSGPFVVKAQVLSGGRGKAGGIRFAATPREIAEAAAAIGALTIGGQPVQSVYLEEKLDIAREFYLAAFVDRDRGCPVILASRFGGVDIEEVARDRIVECPLDPLAGLSGGVIETVLRAIEVEPAQTGAMRDAMIRLHDTLVSEDAELVEINPLVVTRSGALVAADAKIVLDEDAAFRHQGRRAIPEGTAFEEAARRYGVIGIELDGDIAAMMNGAGMTMATLDEITALGGSVRGLVELHGAMARGAEHVAKVIGLMRSLEPKVLLFNIYFQFRNLDTVAEAIALAVRDAAGRMPPIVVRMRGVKEAEARRILEAVDCFVTDDFATACRKAVAVSRELRGAA